MQKLDENGRFVLAGIELSAGRETRFLEERFLRTYATVKLEQTNLSARMAGFVGTVLVNHGETPDYFALRPKLWQLAQQAGLCPAGYLVLDEGAARAVYAAQQKAKTGGAFGRSPILVFFEHTTGTVLVEGTEWELTENGTFAAL